MVIGYKSKHRTLKAIVLLLRNLVFNIDSAIEKKYKIYVPHANVCIVCYTEVMSSVTAQCGFYYIDCMTPHDLEILSFLICSFDYHALNFSIHWDCA